MNIVKLQNELKNVPDQALIGYVQNPTGQVPSYLALSELQRRKDMREKYQAAQPEKSTVAQDLEQQAQSSGLAMLAKNPMPGATPPAPETAPTEQGVASLPTGDMYQEQNFAGGGIIAFDNGGMVDPNERTSWLGRNIGTPIKNWYQREHDQMMLDDAIEKYKLEKGVMPWTATTQAERDAYDAGLAQLQAKRRDIISPPVPQKYPSGDRIPGANVPGNEKEKVPEVKPDTKPTTSQTQTADTSKIFKPVTVATPKSQSLHDYVEEYKKEIGEDPAALERTRRLKAMEDRAAREEERAPWMALAQAGLGMAAGKSPYALQNIAEGATAGLKDYGAAKDKLASLEEKRYALMDAAAKADREAKIAAVQYGKGSMEHQQTLANQIAIQNSQNATQMQIANLNQSVNAQYKQAEQIAKIRDDARENLKAKYKDEGIDPSTWDQMLRQEETRLMVERGYLPKTALTTATPTTGTLQADKSGIFNYVPGKK